MLQKAVQKKARIYLQQPFWWPFKLLTRSLLRLNCTHNQEMQLELKASQDSLAKANDDLFVAKSRVGFQE
jgi:hypothetical protein